MKGTCPGLGTAGKCKRHLRMQLPGNFHHYTSTDSHGGLDVVGVEPLEAARPPVRAGVRVTDVGTAVGFGRIVVEVVVVEALLPG